MAFTEKYVSVAGSGDGSGSSAANSATLTNAFANAVAGERWNILKGSYTATAETLTNSGSATQLIVYRGYDTTIGDLEPSMVRSGASQILDITTLTPPVITVATSSLIPTAGTWFQNISFTSALNSNVMGNATVDDWGLLGCTIANTSNGNSGRCVLMDDDCAVIGCDLNIDDTAMTALLTMDGNATVLNCRFDMLGGVTGDYALGINDGVIAGNLFIGQGSQVGTAIARETFTAPLCIYNNTIYNFGTAISESAAAGSTATQTTIVGNHITDCAEYYNNLYSGTANHTPFEIENRTRDNTTPRTGAGDTILVGEVTTDTGGASTDYTATGSDDFSLISGAPGEEAGVYSFGSHELGAWQNAGGGGVPGNMRGGMH